MHLGGTKEGYLALLDAPLGFAGTPFFKRQ